MFFDLKKIHSWVQMQTEFGARLPDSHISQHSLIHIMEYLLVNKVTDKRNFQNLYKVRIFSYI